MKRLLLAVLMLTVPAAALADAAPDGAAIFKSKCAICHGADGKGQTPTGRSLKVRDLSLKDVQKQSDAELQKIIADGKGAMPSFKSALDQASIDALIVFIRSLKK
jgi:cytochrome c6